MKYLKWFFLVVAFITGAWFGHNFTMLHYEKTIAYERSQHAVICNHRLEEVLERIDLKFCAQWNVTVPPYSEDVADVINEIEEEERRKGG